MSKTIFLDIDGVLNTIVQLRNPDSEPIPINQGSLYLMRKLCESTDARCVLTSQRRFAYELEYLSDFLGLPIIAATGKEQPTRGAEIELVIKQMGIKQADYIIIDDRSDMNIIQLSRLIQTSIRVGFTKQHYTKAIALLTRSDC